MEKPKLWKYKSGIKKGKLRAKSKKYLSFKLKAYWKQKREEESKEEIRTEEEIRTRQQVTYNADYGNSLRAIGFNNQFTEEDLENAIIEFLESNPQLLNIGFEVAGYEDEEIDDSEDKNLNQNEINIQLNDNDISLMKLNRK